MKSIIKKQLSIKNYKRENVEYIYMLAIERLHEIAESEQVLETLEQIERTIEQDRNHLGSFGHVLTQ